MVDFDEEERDFINAHVIARRELEKRRLKMGEDRFRFEREGRLDSHMQRTQDHEAKSLRAEEKRMELEAEKAFLKLEKQHQSIGERKEMLAVLDALVKKLE